MKVAVVGAGVAGAASAAHLTRRGHAVTVFEQFETGHDRGSSHGRSRIVRKAYPDALYTEIMLEAYPMWAELDAASPDRILFEEGLVYFGSEGSEELRAVVEGLQSLGVEHSVAGAAEAGRWMPELRLRPDEVAVHTPAAGWVHADRSVALLLGQALDRGAVLRRERVTSLEAVESEFDAVVLCAGAWNARFLELPVEVTLQTFAYVEGDLRGPVWIEEGPSFLYGFPSEPGATTFKVGIHQRGRQVDPDQVDRSPDPRGIEAIRSVAQRRFGIESPRAREAKGCLYTSTANEDFLLGRVGEKTVFASACSGHGFKFGPWVGKTLAEFVEGTSDPSTFPRFAFTPRRLS